MSSLLANEIVQATLRYGPNLYWCCVTGQFATRIPNCKLLQFPPPIVCAVTDCIMEVEFPIHQAEGEFFMDYRMQKFAANGGFWYTFERVYYQPDCNFRTAIKKGIKWIG